MVLPVRIDLTHYSIVNQTSSLTIILCHGCQRVDGDQFTDIPFIQLVKTNLETNDFSTGRFIYWTFFSNILNDFNI